MDSNKTHTSLSSVRSQAQRIGTSGFASIPAHDGASRVDHVVPSTRFYTGKANTERRFASSCPHRRRLSLGSIVME
jgi:hypothetical protein